jgi:uncharacterized protein (TIRG00374 family)
LVSTSRLVELDESPPRARRPADAVKVIGGAVLVGWGVLSVDVQTAWEKALAGLVTELPPWIRSILAVGSVLGLLYGVGVVLVIVLHRRTRPGALRDVVGAVLLGAGLAAILARVTTGSWPDLTGLFAIDDPTRQFPVLRVVVVTSILVAASPHLSRPMRRTGWLMIAATAIAAVGLGYAHPSDAVGGLGVGLIAGGAVLLVAGSPRGYPNPAAVADALRRMGLSIEKVWIEPEQSWGVRRLGATTGEGDALAIKAYGRDASDSQLMAKAWRALWYREDGRSVSYSRLRAVEHEALVTMFARRAGARVPEVVAAGQASAEIALLVVSAGGRRLDAFDAAEVSDEDVTAVWRDVARLHASAVSHGSLSASAIAFDGTGHTIGDFGLGSLVADDSDRCLDTVELLFSLSTQIGAERAARTAHAGLGSEALTAVLPYLQLPAVSAGARRSADDPKRVIAELQQAVVEATGEELPEPVKLRRVSPRNLVMAGLLALMAWALIPALTGVDYAAVWSVLQGADWGLMFLALLLGQTMFIPEATGMMFAVPSVLPFWPVVTLQIAIKFIGLAVPSMAGRIAMNAAFLHKFGVSIAIAVTQGAIDGFSGFVVQAVILGLALLTGDVDLGLDVTGDDVAWGFILLVVLLIVIGAVIAVTRIARLRDRLVPIVRDGWGAMVAVLREPSRALGLLGSNVAVNLVMAGTLYLTLWAVNAQIDFGLALVAVVATSLLQGLVPIPGGIGVTEAVMTGFLVALGVDESLAFAATITYRAITFYLPALEGFFAMRWLERNKYL